MNENNFILAGDFNTTLSNEDRHYSQSTCNDKTSKHLKDLLSYLNLVGTWNIKHKEKKRFTWCDGNGIPKSRIDFIFMPENWN
jgi:exonuclease III